MLQNVERCAKIRTSNEGETLKAVSTSVKGGGFYGITQAKYYELKANLYSLANELIKEVDIEKTKKVVDFISLIDKLQKEDERKDNFCGGGDSI